MSELNAYMFNKSICELIIFVVHISFWIYNSLTQLWVTRSKDTKLSYEERKNVAFFQSYDNVYSDISYF